MSATARSEHPERGCALNVFQKGGLLSCQRLLTLGLIEGNLTVKSLLLVQDLSVRPSGLDWCGRAD